MLRVAITGGIACGKSLAAGFLAEADVPVCEADRLAHTLMAPGGAAYGDVCAAFGSAILRENGEIDRSVLGDMVFGERAALDRLNAIVHPHVRAAWRAWLDARERNGATLAAVVIPLLFESGAGDAWDVVACVSARADVQRRRLEARGLDARRITQRLAAQWPLNEKESRSDVVLVNNGTEAALREQVTRMLRRIRREDYGKQRH
jgi:dephospho-CoA kinase